MNPIISVVLGSYNRKEFLPLAIDSIRKELGNISHEVIVIDGGSTDGTLEFLLKQFDIITIVQYNRGEWNCKAIERRSWGYFMNLGFKIAQGKYVCMLSDDCLVVPGAITSGYQLFEAELKKGHKVGAMAFYWRDWSSADSAYHVGCTLGNKMYVNHGMFLNKALKDVGFCDEKTFFFYNGDGDLCLKMWNQGHVCIDSPNSYIEHYPHANVDVRKTNYRNFKQDLKNYLKKWAGIFYDPLLHNVGHIIEKKYIDSHKTAEQFNDIHQTIVKNNPHILKGKSWFGQATQKYSWKIKAGIRKLRAKMAGR